MLLPEFQVCKGLQPCKPEIPYIYGTIFINFSWEVCSCQKKQILKQMHFAYSKRSK